MHVAEHDALDERRMDDEVNALADALERARAQVIVVSEEVGWSIVPTLASARAFADVLGRLNQRLAQHATRAYLVVAGYALDLKAGRSVGELP